MSDTTTYTKITSDNISSLEKGDRIYFILAYNSMGVADNAIGKTNDYAEFLKTVGCNIIQGYLYDKPLPEEDFKKKYIP